MATLPNMNIILPTLGQDSGQWDDKLNAALTLVDAHDHTSGKGPRVPTAGININADLAFGGYGPTGLGKAAFNAVTALTTGSKTLFVSSADNELYWRNNGGTNVKLTSGSTINIALVGGIVGDYSSVGAEVAYSDADKVYTFKQNGSPKPWARIASGPVRIYEYNTTETVYVELAINAALASSYTLTLPAALPGSTLLCQVAASGAVSFSNTIATGITLTTGFVHLVAQQETNIVPIRGAGTFSTAVVSDQAEAVITATGNTAVFPLDFGLDSNCVITAITLTGYTLASQPTITFNYSGTNATFTTSGSYGTGASNKTYTFDTPIAVSLNSVNVKIVSGTNDFHFMRASAAWTRP